MAVYSMEGTQENCYPNTTVLINKLNIKDQKQLALAEQRIVTGFYLEAEKETVFENVDFTFYKELHRHLFKELYEWAGTVRNINISKKGTAFCECTSIEKTAELKFRRLAETDFLKGIKRPDFVKELSEFYNDMNYLHPFREGNGRTLRLFVTLLVRNAGYEISFAGCDSDLLTIATIKAAQGDLSLLEEVFDRLVTACGGEAQT